MSTKAVANHVSSKEVKSGYVMEELEQVSRHDPDHPGVGSRLGVGRPAKKMSLAEKTAAEISTALFIKEEVCVAGTNVSIRCYLQLKKCEQSPAYIVILSCYFDAHH